MLGFDGVDGYATAGTLPELGLDTPFTWSFWAKSNAAANTPSNNNIILGNRYPDAGWTKFTTNAWEFRDIAPSFNESIDYPDFAVETWFHHAVVKQGHLFTYYRNGVAMGNTWDNTGVMPADTPLFSAATPSMKTGPAVWTTSPRGPMRSPPPPSPAFPETSSPRPPHR
ncbi:MAG: LamG-like jellyroll fold domain-containing protein [Verrucomicrobiota bacterium]